MPLASVDEWRARIGSSWCALGRPVKSRRPRYREYRYGSPPPGGGKRVKLQDGSVSAILMFILMVVAMLTLWSLILNGYSPICTSIMLCTSLDVVLMQCALCMSLLSNRVSQPVSNIVLSIHRELKLGSGTKLEDFCTKFPISSDLDLLTPGYSSYLSEQVETKVPVVSTIKWNLFRSMSNFWRKLVERVKSIKKCLDSALVKFSLLLRCGDVEENPGPYDQEKDMIMPQWSVAEWSARIGCSWLAIGRPFKTKSSFSDGVGWVRRVLTMNQVVTMTIMMIILIGANLALCALVNTGYHRPIIDLLRFGLLSHWSLYLLNSGYLLVIAVSSCSLSLYQFFPSNTKKSLRQFTCDLKQGLRLISQLILSITEPLISPLLWLINFVGNKLNWMRAVSVVRISLASYQLSKSEASCNVGKEEVQLSKGGELLRRLALARALLDIVLSVAVHIIIFKLLMSGDVEKNPGPGELDYNTVDASTILDSDDHSDVMEEVISIQSKYYALGRSLRLKFGDLQVIRDAYPNESDSPKALADVLLLWLHTRYNADRFGPPTWRMLAAAVDKETGVNSHELAKRIADRHPAVYRTESRHATEANRGEMEQVEKEEFLGIDDIREIIDILWDYRAKWRYIGVELQIKPGDLDAIQEDNRDDEDALLEMIKCWLYRTNPRPTRTVLKAALQSSLLVTDDRRMLRRRRDTDILKILSSQDIRKLEFALTEFIEPMKKRGVDIEKGNLTIKDIAEGLEGIGQHHYSSILIKKGIDVLIQEVVKEIYNRRLKEWGKEEILPVLKIVLCGVPRSGKTSFWKNLVNVRTHDQRSLSTTFAESHSIDVKVDHATLLDWKLCDDGDFNEVTSEIYKKILEMFSERPPDEALPTFQSELSHDASPQAVFDVSQTTDSSSNDSDAIRKKIDSLFEQLKERPTIECENPNLGRVKLMINLIDTGGQSAFLHLLPLLTTGNALYLIFFSYEYSLQKKCTDEFEGENGTIKLSHEYTQIDVILQALRCVSTSITGHDESHVKVLIVGTHEDCCGDQTKIDDSIKEKVQPFFKNDVLQYADVTKDELFVLKVNNVREGSASAIAEGKSIKEEFEEHRLTLDRHINDAAFPQKVLSGSWLLFSIILRRLEKDVLLFEHCKYIGEGLFMSESEVKLALHHMHKNIGIVMHFGDVLCLEDIIICNPALIFRSISSMIIQTYYDPSADRDDHLRFKKHAIFTYNSFVAKKDHPELLQHDKLIVLLQHIGAIAPIKTNPTFKCTLCQNNHAHDKPMQCIHEEYILPCVLPDAMPGELRSVEECCRKMSAPLMITFEGEYTPVGGFCYLFAKLTAEQEGWELCTPPLHSSLAEDYHHLSIYRNKVTFRVDKEYYVTLISTPYCYKVFVESSECIHYFKVWKAIRTLLDKCPNQAIQKKFKLAFDCTCSRNKKHFMILEPSPVSEDYSPYHLTAICETSKVTEPTFKRVAKYMAWFMELKLVREPFQVVRIEKPGDKVTLCVRCAQSKNYSYTWQKDGDAMPQNTAKLVINNFCKSDNGIYTCIVKESVSDYFEEVSTKLISDPMKEQEAHEQNIDTYCTLVATLSVSVDPKLTDPDTTSYQWIRYKQASIDPVKDDKSHFRGANSNKLTVKDLTEEQAGVYCCVVTVSGVPIHSGKATLRVKDPIVEQPAHEQSKYCTSDAELIVRVDPDLTDPDTTSYQWIRYKQASIDPVKDDDHYIGANSNELTVRNLTEEHAGVYYCVVTVSGVPIHSGKATLKVKDLFVKQPNFGEEIKYCTTTAKLSVQVDPKVQDKAVYQWYGGRSKKNVKDDEHFSGANTCQLTVRNLKEEHAGEYYCVVTVDEISVYSRKAELEVQVEYCTSTIQLNVKVDPKVKVSYQWYRFIDNNEHEDQISKNDHFSGVNECQLEIKDLIKEHAGEYYCVISIGNVRICSRKAKLQIKDLFVRQPVSLDKSCCATAHFEVEVDAEEQNCKYYWHKDGNGCKSKDYIGADTPRLTIKCIRKKHEGEYHCVVTVGNSHDRVCSRKAKLTVKGNCSSALNFRCVVAVLLFIALVIVIVMILFAVSNHNGTTSTGLIMSCSASHHEIELGNSLHLWCNASGAQTKSIHWQWLHNGTQLINGDGGVKISEDSIGQTEIQVTHTTHDSGGIYTCSITSEQSSNDTSFTVQIIVPPDPVTNSNPVNVNESPAWEGDFSDDNSILPDKTFEEAYFPHMNEAPDMLQLDYLENKETGKPVKIIETIGSEYSSVGASLLNDKRGNIMNTIESNKGYIAKDVVREIFRRWIKGEGTPVSWKDLVDALKIANFKTLVNEIIDALHTLT